MINLSHFIYTIYLWRIVVSLVFIIIIRFKNRNIISYEQIAEHYYETGVAVVL